MPSAIRTMPTLSWSVSLTSTKDVPARSLRAMGPRGTARPVSSSSNHAAQIDQLVDDMLAGLRHDTTLASTRPTLEFITALYASSMERETVHRRDLTPAHRFYHSLDGGLSADTITARLGTSKP